VKGRNAVPFFRKRKDVQQGQGGPNGEAGPGVRRAGAFGDALAGSMGSLDKGMDTDREGMA